MTSKAASVETPLLEVRGPHHVVGDTLNDEIRFGTVRRALGSAALPRLVRVTSNGEQVFAKEASCTLSWKGDPGTLFDHRQGIVVEDDGAEARSTQTKRGLRARFRWFSIGDSLTSVEVDDQGNALLRLSDRATDGLSVDVPSGNVRFQAGSGNDGGNFSVRVKRDVQFTSARFAVTAQDDVTLSTKGRGEITSRNGFLLKSDQAVNIDSGAEFRGINLGSPDRDKYPVLVAQPDYLNSLSSYFSAQTTLSSALSSYATSAAAAWAAVGPLLMLLDPSGTVMGLCQSAGIAAGQVASAAPQVGSAIGQHLPTLGQMPAGFLSKKTVSE